MNGLLAPSASCRCAANPELCDDDVAWNVSNSDSERSDSVSVSAADRCSVSLPVMRVRSRPATYWKPTWVQLFPPESVSRSSCCTALSSRSSAWASSMFVSPNRSEWRRTARSAEKPPLTELVSDWNPAGSNFTESVVKVLFPWRSAWNAVAMRAPSGEPGIPLVDETATSVSVDSAAPYRRKPTSAIVSRPMPCSPAP